MLKYLCYLGSEAVTVCLFHIPFCPIIEILVLGEDNNEKHYDDAQVTAGLHMYVYIYIK